MCPLSLGYILALIVISVHLYLSSYSYIMICTGLHRYIMTTFNCYRLSTSSDVSFRTQREHACSYHLINQLKVDNLISLLILASFDVNQIVHLLNGYPLASTSTTVPHWRYTFKYRITQMLNVSVV